MIRPDAERKELGRRSKAELESLFGNMYAGWDRGVVVSQERFADGETRFSERLMTSMELAARYVAAEIGANIFEIANRAAFAPIITFSQIQAHIGPVFDGMAAEIDRLKSDLARTARNRDMWKGQCERQAERLSGLQWQHIHTAPKDGTEILLFGACHPSNSRSRYARDANVGWWAGDKWVTRVGGEACEAVLWMPIPATNTIEALSEIAS